MKPLDTLILVATLAWLTGCEKSADRGAAVVTRDPGLAAETVDQTPTDRESAHILQTSNAVILRHASMAKAQLAAGPVRAVADTLIASHTAYNLRAQRTFLAINTVPLDNDRSKHMLSQSEVARGALETTNVVAFGRRYLDLEATFHQQLADQLDTVLLTTARDPFLKQLLQEYRAMIGKHIEMMRALTDTAGS